MFVAHFVRNIVWYFLELDQELTVIVARCNNDPVVTVTYLVFPAAHANAGQAIIGNNANKELFYRLCLTCSTGQRNANGDVNIYNCIPTIHNDSVNHGKRFVMAFAHKDGILDLIVNLLLRPGFLANITAAQRRNAISVRINGTSIKFPDF